MSGEYITLKPGEIVKCVMPVEKLESVSWGEMDDHIVDSTTQPGKYRIRVSYHQQGAGYPKGWWRGQIASREISINVFGPENIR